MHERSLSDALLTYDERIRPARERFARSSWVERVVGGAVTGADLELFLLWFCGLGARMTAPVEGWIRRAGDRCVDLGVVDLGAALRAHAKHEAGHDAMMVSDARALAARRAAAGRRTVDAEAVLARGPTPGVERYVRLHEEVIASAAPFAQIAIEYEIERLSVTFGPAFVARCVAELGEDVKACLSFVEDHVLLDEGHTRFNERQVARFLASRPDALDALVAAGSEALDAYAAFLDDCLALATEAA